MFLPIAHFDLDAFFASVEQKLNPTLRGKPVIVCGVDPQGHNVNRGVVATASYEARVFGVKSGMPVWQARILCPRGIYVGGNFSAYQTHSEMVFEIMEKFAPKVQHSNMDEGFLDFSGCEDLYPNIKRLCKKIKYEVVSNVGIPVSIGISTSRVLAKIACQLGKPNGLFAIKQSDIKIIVHPLLIDNLPGVGPKTQIILEKNHIKTIGDIVKNKNMVAKLLGKHGNNLYLSASGIDNIWYQEKGLVKSISRSITLSENSKNFAHISSILLKLCDEVFYKLLADKLTAKCVAITLRYANFTDKQKSKVITCSLTSPVELYHQVIELFNQIWDKQNKVRLVGVKVRDFKRGANYHKREEIILILKRKYGSKIIQSALVLDSHQTI